MDGDRESAGATAAGPSGTADIEGSSGEPSEVVTKTLCHVYYSTRDWQTVQLAKRVAETHTSHHVLVHITGLLHV